MTAPIRLGTRGSDLALWQARWVREAIQTRLGRACELVVVKTSGDVHTDVSLARLGAKLGTVGLFTKELERALLAGEADVAVHSLKDMPTDVPPGLALAARPVRAAVHDVLLVNAGRHDAAAPGGLGLPHGARVGTSSVRRRLLLLADRPDLELVTIRGNVPTRVDLARTGEVHAVTLAAAGLDRLGLDLAGLVRVDLDPRRFVPAPGQGALALECRADDAGLLALLARLDDPAAAASTEAERLLLHGVGAGCSVPLGALAEVEAGPAPVLLRAALGPAELATGRRPWLRRVLVRAADAASAAALGLRALGPVPAVALEAVASAPSPAPAAGSTPGVVPDDAPAPRPRRLAGRRVLVLREPERARELLALLEAEGALATARAVTSDRPVATGGAATAGFAGDDATASGWVVFASAAAVRHVAGLDPAVVDALRRRSVAAVGPSTAQALAEAEVPVDLVADEGTGEGLARALLERFGAARPPVLLPAARGGRTALRDALAAAGCRVTVDELYASEPLAPPSDPELEVDAVVVASPSGARAAALAGRAGRARAVAIGPTTADALRELGRTAAAVAAAPTPVDVVDAVVRALA